MRRAILQCVGEDEKENYIEFANNDNKNALDIAISYGGWEVFFELLKYIKSPEQKQHYFDLAKQASGSEKRNVHNSDNLQIKGCVKERREQRSKGLVTKKARSHSGAVKDGNNPCSQSEGPTLPYSKKRPRISDGDTQKPPGKKVAQSDSPRQEVKIKSNVGNDESDEQQDSTRESGSEISGSRSNSPDSQEGEQPTLNDVESNGENQEAFSRSSSTSDESDNNKLSEESESCSSVDVRDNVDDDNISESEQGSACNKSNMFELCISLISGISASENQLLEKVKHFVKIGGDINLTSKDNMTLLHLACKNSYWGVAKYLIGNTKVRLDLTDNDGKTPLHHAVYYIKFHLFSYILEKEKKEVIGLILEEIKKNFSQNQQQMYNCINAKDSKGKTPLMYSVQAFRVDTVKMLLEYGADANTIDKEGCTPLDLARRKGFQQIIELLNGSNSLEQESSSDSNNSEEQKSASVGSDKSYEQQDSDQKSDLEANNSRSDSTDSQKDEDGCTLLHIAVAEGKNEVVKTLLKKGDNVNSKDKHGRTPLHDAAVLGKNEVVKTLLEGGASIDSKDEDGCTPLHDAVEQGYEGVAQLLIQNGANVNALNSLKKSPFILAEEESNQGLIKILKNENARSCRNYCEILEMQPGTNLNDVTSANQMRRRSAPF